MSKSKKNIVDPDDIIETYGADTARWFVLSDSPPERDVIWTEEGVQGASRFVQRLWRLVNAAEIAKTAPANRPAFSARRTRLAQGRPWGAGKVSSGIDGCASTAPRPHPEFANALAEVLGMAQARRRIRLGRFGRPPDPGPAVAPMMPHLAEECWQVLGQSGLFRRPTGPKSNAICWLKTP